MMILITGGKGFIGLHTARALIDMGESCVITTSHPERPLPDFIEAEIGSRLFVEKVDLLNIDSLLGVGKRHRIHGIVELAAAPSRPFGTPESFRAGMTVLLNVLEAAHAWSVRRVSMASTIGVYGGVEGNPLREDAPLPMVPLYPILAFKRIVETAAASIATTADFEVVLMRLAAWGPLFHHPPSPMNVPIQLVRAAVNGETLDFMNPPSRAFVEDGADVCYVKDCARGIALLQLADKLNYNTYNIGTGKAMKYGKLAKAIRRVVPDARLDLPSGFDPDGPGRVFELDTTRIREDTGFEPQYDIDRAVADYVEWLRKGNEN